MTTEDPAAPAPTDAADVLWRPSADARTRTSLGRFLDVVGPRHGVVLDSYEAAWQWSVDHIAEFWAEVWRFYDVPAATPYDAVVTTMEMPGAHWFPGATLNYAELALRARATRGDAPAVIARSDSRDRRELTWADLAAAVDACRAGLAALGVGHGDRVAAYLPNIPEATILFLATAGLGAIFTSCPPEFGVRAVLDRFTQIEPKVVVGVQGYRYGTKVLDRTGEFAEICAGLPTMQHVVVVPYIHGADVAVPEGATTWSMLLGSDSAPPPVAMVGAEHPLYVLYSSGTTGLPKPIIHSHAGMISMHLKDIGLMSDIGPADRFFWFTTTGWMMWNYLMSGLLVGATLVLFDGDPASPDLGRLWQLAAEERVTWMGVSAPYLAGCMRAGLEPGRDHDLGALRAIGSTGAPLSSDAARWVYRAVGPDLFLSSISGGTDIAGVLVGGSPLTPVYAGEIPCRSLGTAVEAFDAVGLPVRGEPGELVVTRPLPSMPVGFWGDADGSRYRAAYFGTFPGVWRHGDWITITPRGSAIITGRSDATLNRGGVRIGTAEIYRAVETVPEIADSLIVHLEDQAGGAGELILFVVCPPEAFDAASASVRAVLRRDLSPRHVPDVVERLPAIPTTLSGKKLELPVKKILAGVDPAVAANRDVLKDPAALDAVVAIATRRAGERPAAP